MMFQIKEFFVKNDMRGKGIGTAVYQEFESRLKGKGIGQIILFTSKGADTEHFYHKQGLRSEDGMVFLSKRL